MSDMDTEAEMERRKYIEARIADARDAALNADERASKYKAERDDLRRQLDEARHTIGIYEADGPATALKAKLEAAYDRIDGLVKRCDQIGYEALQDKTETGRLLVEFLDRAETAEARLAEEQSEAYRQRRVHGEQINEAIKMREAAESEAARLKAECLRLTEELERLDNSPAITGRASLAAENARLREAVKHHDCAFGKLGNDGICRVCEAIQSTPTPALRDGAKEAQGG